MDGVKIESWLNIKSGREIRWENWAPPSSSPLFLGHPRANPPRLPLRGGSCICFGEMGRATAPIVPQKPWLGGARPGLAKQPVEGSGVGAHGMIVGKLGCSQSPIAPAASSRGEGLGSAAGVPPASARALVGWVMGWKSQP